jgi:hypothetical protein
MYKIINYNLPNSHAKFLTVHFSVHHFTFPFPIRPSTLPAFLISSMLPINHILLKPFKEPFTHPPIFSTIHPFLLASIFANNSILPSRHQDAVTSCHASHIIYAVPYTAAFSNLPHFPSVFPPLIQRYKAPMCVKHTIHSTGSLTVIPQPYN